VFFLVSAAILITQGGSFAFLFTCVSFHVP
jgi:hypothetical protein